MNKDYIELKNLEVYKLSRQLPMKAWDIYKGLDWHNQKIIGGQFIESVDSAGANIAEGYSRYHYLDKIKFYYNARASLSESCEHWLPLLYEREFINEDIFNKINSLSGKLAIKLNNFISAAYRPKGYKSKSRGNKSV